MSKRPIGVFDSGIGGINVLKSLVKQFPNEDFIYVADTLNCPYGTKSPDEIRDLVTRVSNYLINSRCKAIVIACNTATSYASHLFELKDTVVLGVIYPTANAALKVGKKIAVLATNATINSGIYQEIILDANREVVPFRCSEFVEPIEKGEIQTEYSFNLVRKHLMPIEDGNIDTVILGCTHFALYQKEIEAVFKGAKIINSGEPTSEELYHILDKRNLLNKDNKGKVYIKTTLAANSLKEQLQIFDLNYEYIEKIII